MHRKKRKPGQIIMRAIGRFFALLGITLLALLVLAVGVIYVFERGPSPAARDLLVKSVRETSAIGFLSEIFLTEEQVEEIISSGEVIEEATDTSLITLTEPPATDEPVYDAWGFCDEDGDGIILDEIHREGYSGYMLIVLDPSRVIFGCDPKSFGITGYTVAEMAEKFGAVAAVNGGGFEDDHGSGDGSSPDSLVVYEGKIVSYKSQRAGLISLDGDHILHVNMMDGDELKESNIQYAISFGPALVSNGEIPDDYRLQGGVNPRTCIGQRSDGAILLLVIDGRQVTSIGATCMECAEEMLRYGAVNAGNLDGGSSSMMYYNGEYINSCSSVIGIRKVPTAVLVMPKA